jgi:hypothetical protein
MPFADHFTYGLKSGGMLEKFEPVTVNVRAALPATALVGEIEVIEGDPGGFLTLKVTEFEYPLLTPSIGSQFCTDTWAVTGLLNSAVGITAVSRLLLTKVVTNGVVVVPFVDQTTLLLITPLPSKFDPVMVRVRSGLPGAALVGEIELIESVDGGGGCT